MTQPGEDLHELDVPLDEAAARSVEAPVEDAYEQALPAQPAPTSGVPRVSFDADEADVYEQSQVVALDDGYDY